MQIKFKQHIMDEISDQVTAAAKAKKRIDIITLDQHEWTEFKTYMSTQKGESTSEEYTINGIIIKSEDYVKPKLKG
tara:strand:- start:1111 stop:1338 length:228 start_codon:yes stop_codon:yes gene_type:complete